MEYTYYINLNERGCFNADLRDSTDSTVYEIVDTDHLISLVDDGFMSHCHDLQGLKTYLTSLCIIKQDDKIYRGNDRRLTY